MLKVEMDVSGAVNILNSKEPKKRQKEFLTKNILLLENLCKKECPVDTGRMRSSISSRVGHDYGIVSAHVDYAKYVINGTYKQAPNAYNQRAVMEWKGKGLKP